MADRLRRSIVALFGLVAALCSCPPWRRQAIPPASAPPRAPAIPASWGRAPASALSHVLTFRRGPKAKLPRGRVVRGQRRPRGRERLPGRLRVRVNVGTIAKGGCIGVNACLDIPARWENRPVAAYRLAKGTPVRSARRPAGARAPATSSTARRRELLCRRERLRNSGPGEIGKDACRGDEACKSNPGRSPRARATVRRRGRRRLRVPWSPPELPVARAD